MIATIVTSIVVALILIVPNTVIANRITRQLARTDKKADERAMIQHQRDYLLLQNVQSVTALAQTTAAKVLEKFPDSHLQTALNCNITCKEALDEFIQQQATRQVG